MNIHKSTNQCIQTFQNHYYKKSLKPEKLVIKEYFYLYISKKDKKPSINNRICKCVEKRLMYNKPNQLVGERRINHQH